MSEAQGELNSPWSWKNVRRYVLPVLAIVLLAVVAIALAAGRDNPGIIPLTGEETESGPAQVVPIGETGFSRVILTQRAAERLDIQMVLVREQEVDGEKRLVIPYSALIYGLYGETWAYVSPEPLSYVREPIVVDYIEGDTVFLFEGPPEGTDVVTVGVAELYGTETGVGK
jgi:hypothetical protein